MKYLFLEKALHWRDELFATAGRKEVQFWAGDWNAHIARDAAGARGIGSHLLPSPTKEMGRKLLRWICEAAHDMLLIDSFCPSRKRGTFMNLNGLQRIWNELDVAMISEKAANTVNTVNTVRTIDTNLSDHRAKVYGLSLPKKFKKSWRSIQARAREEKIKPIAVSRMRGRSEEAESKREEVATKIQEKIIEFSKRDHLEGEASGKEKETRMMKILKQSAEEVVGREYTQKMAPFMDGHLNEMRKRTEEINDLIKALLSAKSWPEKEKARNLRNSSTASWRKTKRRDEILGAITIKRPTDMSLADEPTEAEVKKEVSRMKDSAPGADEATSSMLKLVTSTMEGLIALTESMCVLWHMDPREWPEFLHQAVIVSLWKKKGDRSDLDNHRGICLIPVFSRLLVKVIASRLSDFCEREQVFDEGQWGFRPLRSTIGAIGTVRRLVDMATRPNALKDTPAPVIELLDMKKAYPNSSRNAYRRVLVCEGIPEKLIVINMGLEIDAILQELLPAARPKRVKAEKIDCRHRGLLLLPASLHDHEKLRCPALPAQGVIPTAKAAPKARKAPVPKVHIDNEAGTRRQRLDGKGGNNVTLLVCPWCEQKFQRRHQNSCLSMPHARWVDGIREK